MDGSFFREKQTDVKNKTYGRDALHVRMFCHSRIYVFVLKSKLISALLSFRFRYILYR